MKLPYFLTPVFVVAVWSAVCIGQAPNYFPNPKPKVLSFRPNNPVGVWEARRVDIANSPFQQRLILKPNGQAETYMNNKPWFGDYTYRVDNPKIPTIRIGKVVYQIHWQGRDNFLLYHPIFGAGVYEYNRVSGVNRPQFPARPGVELPNQFNPQFPNQGTPQFPNQINPQLPNQGTPRKPGFPEYRDPLSPQFELPQPRIQGRPGTGNSQRP